MNITQYYLQILPYFYHMIVVHVMYMYIFLTKYGQKALFSILYMQIPGIINIYYVHIIYVCSSIGSSEFPVLYHRGMSVLYLDS